MSAITLLLASFLPQAPAALPPPTAAEAWRQVQARYSNAGVLGFQAEGRVLSTNPATAGRTFAIVMADVEVARSGAGSVEVAVQTGFGDQARTVRLASLGTDEGVFSVDCALNVAFPCGADWASSGELDDFAFLGSAWCGPAARVDPPTSVSFVPPHAEHPGLQGLRVFWAQQEQLPAAATIVWLDQHGLVTAADVRLDPETVLHWTFRDCTLRDESAAPLPAAALPAGCKRNEGRPVEAAAEVPVGKPSESSEFPD